MSQRFARGWLVAILSGWLFLSMPALAQTVEHSDADTLDPGSSPPATPSLKPDLPQVGASILTLTNRFRSQNGRGKLKVNPRLSRAAQSFADYLARTDIFSHTADGKRPSQRVSEQGYTFCLVAENIAYEYNSAGFTTQSLARAFVTGWRHSPEHRRNMLDADLDEIGVGVARSAKTGRYYAVQDFGRPKSKAIVFKITNDAKSTIHYTVDGKSFSLDPHYTVTHQRCRSPELDFREAPVKGDSEKEEEAAFSFQPRNGAHFVVRGGRAGGYKVETR
jgi:uncharacterized protein YkwD